MKIYIFYKHYNVEGTDNKHRPGWFDYEKCFTNFLDSIEDEEDVYLHVAMDGNISTNFISKYQDKFIYKEFIGGNGGKSSQFTYEWAKDIAKECDNKSIFYFVENDYLHIKGWVSKVRELYSTYSNLSYVSLYDHNDKYFLPMYNDLVSKIFTTKTHHWRTTPSTCGTFMISKQIMLEDWDVHYNIRGDHNKNLWLAENKERFVITPLPGLNTHCMEGLLSPTINWKQIL